MELKMIGLHFKLGSSYAVKTMQIQLYSTKEDRATFAIYVLLSNNTVTIQKDYRMNSFKNV